MEAKFNELVELDIMEAVEGPTPRVNTVVVVPELHRHEMSQ